MLMLEKLKLKIDDLKARETHLKGEIGGLLERNRVLSDNLNRLAALNRQLEARAKKGEQYLDDSIKLSNDLDDLRETNTNLEQEIRHLADDL